MSSFRSVPLVFALLVLVFVLLVFIRVGYYFLLMLCVQVVERVKVLASLLSDYRPALDFFRQGHLAV